MSTLANIPRGYYRKHETADYIGISTRTLSNFMRSGKIPFIRLTGRLVLFKTSDIDKALESFRIGGEVKQ